MFLSLWPRRRREMPLSPASPFPWKQMFVLALCRLCEPVAFMSVFPYTHSMMKDFGITEEHDIALYASMVTSAFAFAEFSTGFFWGRISDRIGRKPVLLMGMFGTGLSMLMFGFAPNFYVALIARALGGLLNGNIGVIQSVVTEIVKDDAHKPRAHSIMPFVWSIGSIIGAALGGALSNPAKEYPRFFHVGSIWEQYPYLLPNLVCVTFVFFSLIVGFLYLEETQKDKKGQQDHGLRLGQLVAAGSSRLRNSAIDNVSRFWTRSHAGYESLDEKDFEDEDSETSPLLPPSAPTITYQSTTEVSELEIQPQDLAPAAVEDKVKESVSLREALSGQILLVVCGTGILAFHTISLEQQLPLLMAAPSPTHAPQLPFKFEAGFDMSDKTIGSILAMQGFMQMFAQLILFPMVSKRIGGVWTWRLVIFAYPVLYFFIPYLGLLPKSMQVPGIYLVLVWKVIGQALSYPSGTLMIADLAPSSIRGAINGIVTSSQSLSRGFGPIFSGAVQSAGTSMGYSGLVWWVISAVALIGAIEALFMRSGKPAARDEEAVVAADGEPMQAPPLPSKSQLLGDFYALESDEETTVGEESDLEDEGTLCSPSPAAREGSLDSRRPSLDLDRLNDVHAALLPKDV